MKMASETAISTLDGNESLLVRQCERGVPEAGSAPKGPGPFNLTKPFELFSNDSVASC
jgi:hypothetical protein